jgi:Do/DeqQ family serine protease
VTRRTLVPAAALAAAATLGGGVALGLAVATGSLGKSTTTTIRQEAPVPAVAAAVSRGGLTVNEIYRRAAPAVVQITSTTAPTTEVDPFFGFRTEQPAQQALGSGFVLDKQGHIVTNFHVVEGAQQVEVSFSNQKTYKANVVGTDPSTDLAVLRVDVSSRALTPLMLADSDKVTVGDAVVAIGNPFGLDRTATAGIVSALQRLVTAPNGQTIDHVIQTDAPINSGNSGGPLLNAEGEVIGVNSQISSPNGGGNVGIGFAVPSNVVRAVVDQLLRHGEVRRGRIGVAAQELTPDLAEAAGVAGRTEGALVTRVDRGSAAERGGLRPGDIVVAVDGAPVRSAATFLNRLGLAEPGSTLELAYLRNGERRTARVRITATEESEGGAGPMVAAGGPLTGASLADIPEGHPAYGGVQGAFVARIARGSPAAALGLRPGDIVLGIDGRAVRSAEELQARLQRRQGAEGLALNVLRGDTELLLMVR